MPAKLAQERGARQGQQGPGPAGAEGRHQLRGAHLRDAEELLEVAADEEVAVELFELADGVGDGEQPPGRGGHLGAPCRLQPLRRGRVGKMSGEHAARHVSKRSFRIASRGGDPRK